MPKVTFDTNIFIARHRDIRLPENFYMSVVVLNELVVGAADEAAVKVLDVARRHYIKTDRLLVPDGEDWWLAGKVLNAVQRGRKSRQGGLTPSLAADEKYRITNDVLIARTAKRAGVTVISDNLRNFEMIHRFCAVRLQSATDYFGG